MKILKKNRLKKSVRELEKRNKEFFPSRCLLWITCTVLKIPQANLNFIYIYSAWAKDIRNVNNTIYLPHSQQPGGKSEWKQQEQCTMCGRSTVVPWRRDDKVQRRRRCAQEDVGNNEELRGSAAQRGNQPGCIQAAFSRHLPAHTRKHNSEAHPATAQRQIPKPSRLLLTMTSVHKRPGS